MIKSHNHINPERRGLVQGAQYTGVGGRRKRYFGGRDIKVETVYKVVFICCMSFLQYFLKIISLKNVFTPHLMLFGLLLPVRGSRSSLSIESDVTDFSFSTCQTSVSPLLDTCPPKSRFPLSVRYHFTLPPALLLFMRLK